MRPVLLVYIPHASHIRGFAVKKDIWHMSNIWYNLMANSWNFIHGNATDAQHDGTTVLLSYAGKQAEIFKRGQLQTFKALKA